MKPPDRRKSSQTNRATGKDFTTFISLFSRILDSTLVDRQSNYNVPEREQALITTAQEAAKQLGMSQQHFGLLIKRGLVSARRAGRIVLVDPSEARKDLEAKGYSWGQRPRKSRENKSVQVAP